MNDKPKAQDAPNDVGPNDIAASEATLNEAAPADPKADSVVNYLMYGLSIPERALRSTSAAVSGAVRESATYLVPSVFRSSKSYTVFVQQMLDFMTHDIGGVEKNEEEQGDEGVKNFVARKAVGGFIELSTMPLLHVSPMTVLAIVSDVAYGSQTFLRQLSVELKEQGVIDENSTIDHASDLLDAIRETTTKAADALDTPPLSVDGLAETIKQITEQAQTADLTKSIPQAELERMWNGIYETAAAEDQNVLEISSAMTMFAMNRIGSLGAGALSTISVAGDMFEKNILDHYWNGLGEINERGFYSVLSDCSKPYIDAMWLNFSSDKETITEDVLSGKLLSRTWNSVSTWLMEPPGGKKKEPVGKEDVGDDENGTGGKVNN